MKDFDANKGIWGAIVLIITILTFLIVVYQFTTGNTHLSISINLSQPAVTSVNVTPRPTVTSPGITPNPTVSTTAAPKLTPQVKNENTNTTPTIFYTFWTWAGWVIAGAIAVFFIFGFLGLFNNPPPIDHGTLGGFLIFGFSAVVFSAWLSSLWLSHIPYGFLLSLSIECGMAVIIAIIARIVGKSSRML